VRGQVVGRLRGRLLGICERTASSTNPQQVTNTFRQNPSLITVQSLADVHPMKTKTICVDVDTEGSRSGCDSTTWKLAKSIATRILAT
jgi:hypothetical protein